MTTLEMEINLMRYLDFKRNIIVTNITPISQLVGFETDILSLSQSGYATALEIKVSKADLKADLKKYHIISLDYQRKLTLKNLYKNIKYFYYAVPQELEDEALRQIPDFTGLYVVKTRQHPQIEGIEITEIYEVKKPQQINPVKWNDKMKSQLTRLGCMRIFSLKKQCKSQLTEIARLRQI